jgi:hypothetical protein
MPGCGATKKPPERRLQVGDLPHKDGDSGTSTSILMYPRMASLAMARASSSVSPSVRKGEVRVFKNVKIYY